MGNLILKSKKNLKLSNKYFNETLRFKKKSYPDLINYFIVNNFNAYHDLVKQEIYNIQDSRENYKFEYGATLSRHIHQLGIAKKILKKTKKNFTKFDDISYFLIYSNDIYINESPEILGFSKEREKHIQDEYLKLIDAFDNLTELNAIKEIIDSIKQTEIVDKFIGWNFLKGEIMTFVPKNSKQMVQINKKIGLPLNHENIHQIMQKYELKCLNLLNNKLNPNEKINENIIRILIGKYKLTPGVFLNFVDLIKNLYILKLDMIAEIDIEILERILTQNNFLKSSENFDVTKN